MQQLILAKCISGVRMDSEHYNIGWAQATTDYFNLFPVPSYPKSTLPAKAINHERTVFAGGQINSTNGCYAGYYDHMLPLCYPSHTCNKYNPIKPIGYPPKVIPTLPPPPIENSTRLVYDNYYGAGDWRVEGASNSSIIASFYPQRDYRSNIIIQIKNLTTNYTPDQYLNSLMRGDKQTTRIFRI
jgi:hypothetical protein